MLVRQQPPSAKYHDPGPQPAASNSGLFISKNESQKARSHHANLLFKSMDPSFPFLVLQGGLP